MSLFPRPLRAGSSAFTFCARTPAARAPRSLLHTSYPRPVQRLLWAGAVLDETSPRLRPATGAWMSALGMGRDAEYGLSFTRLAASPSHSLLAYRTLPPSGYEIPAPPEQEQQVYAHGGAGGPDGTRLLSGGDAESASTAAQAEDPRKYAGLEKIVSIGRNTHAELGLGFTSHEMTWGMVQSSSNFGGSNRIKQLGAGLNTSWAVMASAGASSDRLFAWGNNSLGQLGLGQFPGQSRSTSGEAQLQLYSSPKQVELPPRPDSAADAPTSIDRIAVGLDHALVLRSWSDPSDGSRRSEVLGCGLNTDAQLGLPVQTPYATSLTPIIADNELSDVRTSGDSSFAFASGGRRALAWGNSEYAQAISGARPIDRIEAPVSLDEELSAALNGENVKDIASGGSWTLLLTDAGRVLSVGYGAIGSRGSDDKPQSLRLQEIPAFDGLPIRAIASGLEYACAITSDERLFVWGLNSPFGRLGLGSGPGPNPDPRASDPRVFTPTEVPLPPSFADTAYTISDVVCGGDTMWVLVEQEDGTDRAGRWLGR